jgi:carbon-monoxide dehydrogenase medium subunit
MIPRPFSYTTPTAAEHAVSALGTAEGSAHVLSGGTWLVPHMGRGLVRPSAVVDLKNAGMNRIELGDGLLRVGATCTYTELLSSPVLAREAPLLKVMASGITGGRQIQNQGTIGGSACAARPASDAPTALVAQGGAAVILGPGDERRLPLDDFFVAAGQTALEAGEMLVGFDLTPHPGAAWGYYKLKHSASSWPIATAAARVSVAEDGVCTAADLVLGGVGQRPLHIDVSELLVGYPLDEERLRRAAELAPEAVQEPYEDELATAEYRIAVAAPTALRALRRARLDNERGDAA